MQSQPPFRSLLFPLQALHLDSKKKMHIMLDWFSVLGRCATIPDEYETI